MQHARLRTALRRRVVPVLLTGAVLGAFGGLVAVSPSAPATDVLVAAAPPVLQATPASVERERVVARASRSRRVAEAEAAARVRAEAAAAARAAEDAAAAQAAAEAAAAAQAAAAAAAAAERAEREAAERADAVACPVPGARFTDTWGAARSGGRRHQGTDLLAPLGTPVHAVVAGRVRTASSSLGGISLYLDGDNGETYFYAHNSANVASTGQRVRAGDLVARVGSTGNAGNIDHVHFERQVGGRSVNPYGFLRRAC